MLNKKLRSCCWDKQVLSNHADNKIFMALGEVIELFFAGIMKFHIHFFAHKNELKTSHNEWY